MKVKHGNWALVATFSAFTAFAFACGKSSSGGSPAAANPPPVTSGAPVASAATPGTTAAPGSGTTAAAQATPPAASAALAALPMQTLILNKPSTTTPYTQASLTLELGVGNGPIGSTAADYQFLCEIQGQTTFTPCADGTIYTFNGLTDGTYSLTVQAVLLSTNTPAAVDSVTFTVDLAATTSTPATQSATATTTSAQAPVGSGTVLQQIEHQQQNFLVSNFYQVAVPASMHVTEYATTTGLNPFSFYRVSPTSDPFYVGNYACNSTYDSVLASSDQAGASFNYCLSTPPSAKALSFMAQNTVADNHLEIAQDPTPTSSEEDIIDVNVFDTTFPYQHGRSRFEQLCASAGNMYLSPSIPVMQSFWGSNVNVHVVACTTKLVMPNGSGGLPSVSASPLGDSWWIAGFMINAAGLDTSCFGHGPLTTACQSYSSTSLLEVTVVTNRPYTNPEDLVRYAQQTMLTNIISQTQPLAAAKPAAAPAPAVAATPAVAPAASAVTTPVATPTGFHQHGPAVHQPSGST